MTLKHHNLYFLLSRNIYFYSLVIFIFVFILPCIFSSYLHASKQYIIFSLYFLYFYLSLVLSLLFKSNTNKPATTTRTLEKLFGSEQASKIRENRCMKKKKVLI